MPNGIAGIAERIRDVQIAGIPLGEAALGGGSALLVSELTDGVLVPRIPQAPVALVKGAEAYVMSRWGHRVIGAGGARVATLFLTYDAVRSLIPLDDWVKRLVEMITGAVGGGTTSDAYTSAAQGSGGNGHQTDAMDELRTMVAAGGVS